VIPAGRPVKVLLIDSNVYFAKRLGDAFENARVLRLCPVHKGHSRLPRLNTTRHLPFSARQICGKWVPGDRKDYSRGPKECQSTHCRPR